MKISREKLNKIIQEELETLINEESIDEEGFLKKAAGAVGGFFKGLTKNPNIGSQTDIDTLVARNLSKKQLQKSKDSGIKKFTQGPSTSPLPTVKKPTTTTVQQPAIKQSQKTDNVSSDQKNIKIKFLEPAFDDPKQMKFEFTQMVKDRAKKNLSLKKIKQEVETLKQSIENKKTEVNNLRNELENSGIDTGELEEAADQLELPLQTTQKPTLKDLYIASKNLNRDIRDLKEKEQQIKQLETEIDNSTAKINDFRNKLEKLNIEVDLEENKYLQENKEVNRWKKLAGLIKG